MRHPCSDERRCSYSFKSSVFGITISLRLNSGCKRSRVGLKMVQGRADIPELTAIEAALELGQCKHITTREKEPCQETHEPRVVLGGYTGSRSVQPKISTSHFSWLSHGGIRKMKMVRGMWHFQSAQLSGRGMGNLVLQDTSQRGCRLKKPLCLNVCEGVWISAELLL